MKISEEARQAMREQFVPRLALLLDMAEEAVEGWRKSRGEDEGPVYTGELPLSELLMVAQIGVNLMAQATLGEMGQKAAAEQPAAPPPSPEDPAPFRVAPPLTEEQVRNAEEAVGKILAFPTPEQVRDAEKALGEVLEAVGVTEKQWTAIEEFLRFHQDANVMLQVIVAGR